MQFMLSGAYNSVSVDCLIYSSLGYTVSSIVVAYYFEANVKMKIQTIINYMLTF